MGSLYLFSVPKGCDCYQAFEKEVESPWLKLKLHTSPFIEFLNIIFFNFAVCIEEHKTFLNSY